jgi:hypothetical protein
MRIAALPSRSWGILLALAASVAILVQVLASGPLLLRMADDIAAPICLSDAGEPLDKSGSDHTAPGVPHSTHDHAQCVLCQGGLAPIMPGGAPRAVPRMLRPATADRPAPIAATERPQRFESYAWRAPPGPPTRAWPPLA